MRNKLATISLALLFGFGVSAQSADIHGVQDAKISIYPNPAVGYIVVDLDQSFANTKFELNSMIGNKMKIQPEELGSGKFRIPLEGFATGYYFLIIKDEASRTRKVRKFLLRNN